MFGFLLHHFQSASVAAADDFDLPVGQACFKRPHCFLSRTHRLQGPEIPLFKFRSMELNVETAMHETHFANLIRSELPMVKLNMRGDSRLIRGGGLFRALGLDELPQIFNVIRGEMSLVGPRPCTPNEFEFYTDSQKERVNAPPGLTGEWQVHGKNERIFSEMIEMDIRYAKSMSFSRDLSILAKTFPTVLREIRKSRFQRSKVPRRKPETKAEVVTN